MKKEIQTLIYKINNTYKKKKIWKYIVGLLSIVAIFITIYSLIMPAIAYSFVTEPTNGTNYKIYLKDSYQDSDGTTKYSWKQNYYTDTSPNYELDLYYEDTNGNVIKGKDVTIEVGKDKLEDKIYGFGGEPISDDGKKTSKGKNLIDEFKLKQLVTKTGEKYEFVEAKIKIDGTDTWYTLEKNNYWHIWCQYSGQTTDEGDYGWRGDYIDSTGKEVRYFITNANKDNIKYKFIYKKVRYGNTTTDSTKTVFSLDNDSGITFKLFNYSGDLSGTGDNNINNNGTYEYFAFRDSSLKTTTQGNKTNTSTDADGFGPNRAKVEFNLGKDGYPIFDCKTKGGCTNNFSLGYLFGATTNPAAKGVTSYTPNNTLLQNRIENGVKYYYYDSNLNAVDYDTENNYFLVRNYVERGQSMTSYPVEAETRYEFMPFNYLNDNSTGYTADNNVTYDYKTPDIDHWFGMTMEFEFYMPKDGKINGQDMIFSFTGDDDVWVFIDDVLVLDLGGTHGAVDGNINFATGKVEGYLNWNGKNHKLINEENLKNEEKGSDYYNETTIYQAYTLANNTAKTNWKEITNDTEKTSIYADYTPHTLKFFYLERGAAVTNCKINFNIPVLPPGSLSVKKEFEGTENYGESFDFQLYNTITGENIPVKDAEYTLKSNGKADEVKPIGADGTFSLKVGEEAIFSLDSGHYSVVEKISTESKAISHSCILDGNNCQNNSTTDTGSFEMTPEGSHQVVFTNKVKTLDLTISKLAYDETTESFDFMLTVKNKFGSPVDIPCDSNSKYTVTNVNDTSTINFSLTNEESITIIGIPIDTEVILQEISHNGYHTIIKTSEEETLVDGDTYKFTMDEVHSKNIVVHNIPGITLPETGGTGIWSYIVIGSILMLTSLIFGFNNYFKLKEGDR